MALAAVVEKPPSALAGVFHEAAVHETEAACEARRATQMESFDGYAMEQYAMEENAILDVRGNYVLFISASDPNAADQAFRGAL